MGTVWKQIHRIGIAIWNYQSDPTTLDGDRVPSLGLLIGDLIQIVGECEQWFYGYRLNNSDEAYEENDDLNIISKRSSNRFFTKRIRYGAFPKSYVKIKFYDSNKTKQSKR
ncbi:hypothetical protein QR98_0029980 [Sarcoptes scabiei]|nr:hypothetical protein QR98_0029980 [Sarcoptes scabiei]